MHEQGASDKLVVVLKHWMKHNRGHSDEFASWAEKARAGGHENVAQRILEAVGQLERANESLALALEELGGG